MKGACYGKIHDYKRSLSAPNVFISPPILYHIYVYTGWEISLVFFVSFTNLRDNNGDSLKGQ
jgi:hypothetical protein